RPRHGSVDFTLTFSLDSGPGACAGGRAVAEERHPIQWASRRWVEGALASDISTDPLGDTKTDPLDQWPA
ncbi:MAG: hypothetical protein OXG44_04370, partial [Gammaproteobacteria bacterium]|nr:hypothetical protein [Gammaproteobacteria bacterium]